MATFNPVLCSVSSITMHAHRNIGWTTPASMLASLLAGALFALAHHILYSKLAGTTAASGNYNIAGYDVSQQQINIASGNALAFLAKACLVLAVSIAYTQAFWKAVGRSKTEVRTLDTTSSALNNVWAFVRVQVWWKYPLLLLLALSVWYDETRRVTKGPNVDRLIPIASVITPATLSVVVAPEVPPPASSVHVPQADFNSLKLISPGEMMGHSFDPAMVYNGPDQIVQRIAQAVASSGSILPITPPGANTSWQLNFPGPYIKCNDVNATLKNGMQQNILLPYRNGSYCQNYFNYLSWTATPGNTPGAQNRATDPFANSPLPFAAKKPFDMHTGALGPLDYAGFEANLSTNASQVATIYFAVMPNFKSLELGECPLGSLSTSHQDLSKNFETSTFLQCQLYNTTYRANFTYSENTQDISMDFPNLDQATLVDTLAGIFFNDGDNDCSTINASNETCTIDPVTLQRLSYQAVMDAFGRVLIGSVHNGDTNKQSTYVVSTNVLSTSLVSTRELAFLSKDTSWTQAGDGVFQNSSAEVASLYSTENGAASQQLLKDSLEELFRNITISMLSSSALQSNKSSPFAPPPVNVTFHTYAPTYVYAVKTLWFAYGIAIIVSAVGVVAGLCCMFTTGASFSNDFSTILRATRHAAVGVDLKEGDGDGKDPLPRYLAEATVLFEGGIWNRSASLQGSQIAQPSGGQNKGRVRLIQRSS